MSLGVKQHAVEDGRRVIHAHTRGLASFIPVRGFRLLRQYPSHYHGLPRETARSRFGPANYILPRMYGQIDDQDAQCNPKNGKIAEKRTTSRKDIPISNTLWTMLDNEISSGTSKMCLTESLLRMEKLRFSLICGTRQSLPTSSITLPTS